MGKAKALKSREFHYCAGCGHRIMHRLIAQCIDDMGNRERVIGIAPVGCAVFAYDYFNFDMLEVPHGRPPAAATAIKRVRPLNTVFTYQGDGDLAAIGLSEIIHAAIRGENISVFFINNATFGMTGGQMAPTTLIGQVTTTTPKGRETGTPMRVAEMISSLGSAFFVARGTLDGRDNIGMTSGFIRKALEYQEAASGFTFVEALSPCPTDWHMSPRDSSRWIREEMTRSFPTGVLLDRGEGS
jgi:2-oxoglutarate ferredoxin oxidoreductase subunit beta